MSNSTRNQSRRKLLRNTLLATGTLAVMPAAWTRPVVDSVILPSHAMTSTQSICEIAASTGVHTTLVQLLTDTGLADAVCNASELTVWAPTDSAFAAISDVLETLTPEQVKAVLVHHTASGTQAATPTPETTITPPNVGPSVPASNGVVHVIDQVLVPAL